MASSRTVLLILTSLATGLLAGFFYAYPSSVSPGLADLGDAQYVAAMQSINEAVPNGLFVLSFVGAPILLLAAVVLLALGRDARLWPVVLAFGLVLAGILVTIAASVPLNDELALVDLDAGAKRLAQARADYEDSWNTWNAIRTLACAAGLGCLGWALARTNGRRPATSA